MYKRILVTGSNGFIGKNFNSIIPCTRDHCNLLDFKQTLAYFDAVKPDAIIHTAGKIGGILGNSSEKGTYCFENNMINTNVIEAARLCGVKRVLSFLSSCAYPVNATIPYKEESFHDGLPHEDHYGYAYAKRMLDIMSRTYHEQYGLIYNGIILSNVYGPYDHFSNVFGHVIPSLIKKCYDAKKHNVPFILWGDGSPQREFVYVEDIVNLSYYLLNHFNEPGVLNVSHGIETSIKDAAIEIARIMDFKGKIQFTNHLNGQIRKPVNTDRFNSYVHNYNFKSLQEGLFETISWFLANAEKE